MDSAYITEMDLVSFGHLGPFPRFRVVQQIEVQKKILHFFSDMFESGNCSKPWRMTAKCLNAIRKQIGALNRKESCHVVKFP